MTIQAVIDWTQTQILVAAPAIKHAPGYATDKKMTVPTSVIFPTNIRFSLEGGFALTFFDLRIEVMIPKRSLDDSLRVLFPLVEPIGKIFTDDPTLGGHCQTSGMVTANIAQDVVADIPMIGFVFVVPDIKM